MIEIKAEQGFDKIISKIGGFCVHACSECGGTREVTGHKYWCTQGKKAKEDEDE